MPHTSHDFLDEARRVIPEVSVEDVAARRTRGDEVVLLDVREHEEVRTGSIEGAVTIPRGFLEFQAAAHLPQTDADIVVYCASGARSLLAAQVLRAMGYTRVASMVGGITRWKEAGYPVVRDRQLSAEQLERYSRHFLLRQMGEHGQGKLLDAKVLLVGAGGLGSPVALYLAAAGVGTLGIVDADVVDRSNLQRQVLHTTDRVGMPKTESAAMTIHALNPDVQVRGYPERLTVDNVMVLFQDYDIIVDGSDNFPTRYLVNDAAVLVGKPVVHGSIFQFEGQVSVFKPHEGPCYRCLYPTPPPPGMVPSCSEVGVLGVLPGVIGVIQATETIKLLIGQGEPLVGRLLMYDALAMRFREIRIRRDPDCPLCGAHPTITALLDYEEFCGLDTAALATVGA
jgi:molybdopterin/thiamine biosynthesis adenylyltransferase/rhodanese-related sulfurtransferase